MSVAGSVSNDSGDGPQGKTILAGVPVTLPVPGRSNQRHRTPQQRVDEFWKNFTTEAPGRVTAVIPKNSYAERVAKRAASKAAAAASADGSSVSPKSTGTQASYEEAAALCRAKVEKIVRECKRVNQKYRDPHFDLEWDLKTGRRDCLESLSNCKDDYEDPPSDTESYVSRRSGLPPRQRRERPKDISVEKLSVSGPGAMYQALRPPTSPKGRDPRSSFSPGAVKRVTEIFDDPKFYIEGATANDVRQGRDGDCWLMAALCTMSNKAGLIEKICVAHDPAVGVYGFVFHRDGEWHSEIIDDKLYLTKADYDEVNLDRLLWDDRDRVNSEEIYRKTYQSNSGALYFAQCENPNETWLPLLEKAYAKAHGDYSAIEGGFTGEGIEDLTGGVTSELTTTDILDKEYFWREELMKVNEQFLFGCSTGMWGRGWGDRKGIKEGHAYSVLRAIEMDGERLLLLKNPWGKGEWKGAWSDGSKEWTAEWLKKLDHRFGDDGAFWISYDDLLRKYQAFDRTRLFGPEWRVNSIWTTMSVPWTLEYHDTKFCFTLAKPCSVVLVLSQLDERYFRGLEGQYRFTLAFRLHKAGEDDYLVRSRSTYRMKRSVNVELEDLEAGEYHFLVRLDATRLDYLMPAEEVVQENAKDRREKLIRIGLAYDLAHAKGKMVESAEEKKAREAYAARKKSKAREKLRKRIQDNKQKRYYIETRNLAKSRKRAARRAEKIKEKKAAREERTKDKQRQREEEWGRNEIKQEDGGKEAQSPVENDGEHEGANSGKMPKSAARGSSEHVKFEEPEAHVIKEQSEAKDDESSSSSEGQGARPNDDKLEENKENESEGVATGELGQEAKLLSSGASQEDDVAGTQPTEEQTPGAEGMMKDAATSTEDYQEIPGGDSGEDNQIRVEDDQLDQQSLEPQQDGPLHPDEIKVRRAIELLAGVKEDLANLFGPDNPLRTHSSYHPSAAPTEFHDSLLPSPQVVMRRVPPNYPPFGRPGSPPRERGRREHDDESESDGTEDFSSVASVSDMSERNLDYAVEEMEQDARERHRRPVGPPGRVPMMVDPDDDDPWNAVAVVGLRIYYKASDFGEGIKQEETVKKEGEDDKNGHVEVVQLRVIRPNPYDFSDDEDEKEKDEEGDQDADDDNEGEEDGDEAMVLDLDDSAKDATLKEQERALNIAEGNDVGETC